MQQISNLLFAPITLIRSHHISFYLMPQTISAEGSISQDSRNHLESSIRFLNLRISSEYDDDFVEQRWSSMLLLGSLYATYMVRAVKEPTFKDYWLSVHLEEKNTWMQVILPLHSPFLSLRFIPSLNFSLSLTFTLSTHNPILSLRCLISVQLHNPSCSILNVWYSLIWHWLSDGCQLVETRTLSSQNAA